MDSELRENCLLLLKLYKQQQEVSVKKPVGGMLFPYAGIVTVQIQLYFNVTVKGEVALS